MYKTYHVSLKDSLAMRTGTDGYQPKFIVDGGKKFLKVQATISNQLVNDWKVEVIASKICTQLGIAHVVQTPCKVIIDERPLECFGVVSENFEKKGMHFISYESLINKAGYSSKDSNFIKLSSTDKFIYISKMISTLTSLSLNKVQLYLLSMTVVDLLVCNQDRHTRNFGVFFDNSTGRFSIALLFDFGMGLFENDIWYKDCNSLQQCLRSTYIEPYSEDPFVLFNDFNNAFKIKQLVLQSASELKVSKNLFSNKFSYEYFKRIKKCFDLR